MWQFFNVAVSLFTIETCLLQRHVDIPTNAYIFQIIIPLSSDLGFSLSRGEYSNDKKLYMCVQHRKCN